jgi:hypothetical protein
MSVVQASVAGKNGVTTGVDGKRRNRISAETFAEYAFKCEGDIREMSKKENLDQPAAAILGRYKNLVKKGFQYQNKSLPPYKYVALRKYVPMTMERLLEMARVWQKWNGLASKVAEEIGISVQTLKNWHKKLNSYLEKYGHTNRLCPVKSLPKGRSSIQLTLKDIQELNDLISEWPADEDEEESEEEQLAKLNEELESLLTEKNDEDENKEESE